VIITGISTDVCCDTTAREANARDFLVLFVSDRTAVNAENEEEAAASQQAFRGEDASEEELAPRAGRDEPLRQRARR